MRVGILAVQGAFLEHEKMMERLGVQTIELRKEADAGEEFDGLILPGGESTVQGKLLRELGMFQPLKEKIENGIPVLATCAGMILLAEQIENDERRYFQSLPVKVKRNAYGRQLGSFHYEGEVKGIGRFPMEYIRAPYVEHVSDGVEVLACVEGKVTGVRYQNQLAFAFHPELSEDSRIHEMFLEYCASVLYHSHFAK